MNFAVFKDLNPIHRVRCISIVVLFMVTVNGPLKNNPNNNVGKAAKIPMYQSSPNAGLTAKTVVNDAMRRRNDTPAV